MTWTASNRINSNQISSLFRLNWPDPIFVSEVALFFDPIGVPCNISHRIVSRRWSVADKDYRSAPRSTPAAHVLNGDGCFLSRLSQFQQEHKEKRDELGPSGEQTPLSLGLSWFWGGPCDQVTVHQRAPQINLINFTQCDSDPSV